MKKLTGNDLQKIKHLYEKYESNEPVIFSVFEGQFEGFAYVDDCLNPAWSILQTPFLQHFIAGSPTDGCTSLIEDILFNNILSEQREKELVVFSDSNEWNDKLDCIFQKHKGVSDSRKIFGFSMENYILLKKPMISDDIEIKVVKEKGISVSLKETWSAKVVLNNKIVSSCSALMVGRNKVEIDISTEEEFRGKGYATMAAMFLIDKTLEDGMTPCWSTWPFREESQHIAKKLGFISMPDVKAWIWMEGM